MKKILLLATTAITLSASGQTPFNRRDSININHINATVLLHGDLWNNPVTNKASCEFPKNSKKHISHAGALWMSGYDESNQLHVTAQTYRQDGNDYWPGPLDASGALSATVSAEWARFWKIRKTDIQYFLSLPEHTTLNTPISIMTWPAAGNSHATGAGMAPLSIPVGTSMAPFIDINGNGIYEPLEGDYPDVKGDEALWWVYSDNGPTHNNTNGLPLGVEVHALSYAYSRHTLMDNVIYYEYTITNKSIHTYSNVRVAQFSDGDIGDYMDDYIGFDSVHRMSIFYNGVPDDGIYNGHPQNCYRTHAPVQGTTVIVFPGDTGNYHKPPGSFIYYNNDYSNLGNPHTDTQFNHYIRGFMGNGHPFMDNSVIPPKIMRYTYPDDPSLSYAHSQCAYHDQIADKRTVLSSDSFTLHPGATVKMVMALVVTDTNQGGCPDVNFNAIKEVADTAWANYYNPPPPLSSGILYAANGADIKVFPNPANNTLHIELLFANVNDNTFTIHNTLGQLMHVPIQQTGTNYEANITQLPTGVYYLGYMTNGVARNIKFVKE
jgi:hypothetical protein